MAFSLVFVISMLSVVYGYGEQINMSTVTAEVWFDIEIRNLDGPGNDFSGRVVVALFGEAAPMTTLNFASLAKGYKKGSEKLHFKNSHVHRVVPDFVIQMGDITTGDGTGGKSIYGEYFDDEDFIMSHQAAGFVAMANHGTDTNGSQFYITLQKARWLDGKHVVFGKVIKGMDTVQTIGNVPVDSETGMPERSIKIVDCGVIDIQKKYQLTAEQLNSDKDIE